MIEYKAEIDVLKNDTVDLLTICEKYLIKDNLLKIYQSDSIENAYNYFDIIEDVLPFIERFQFSHHLKISDFLKNTIRYLDRVDTDEVRVFYFNEIKQKGVDSLWEN